MVYKIGWFSTGRDPAARKLLQVVHDNITSGVIPGEISFVFCNRQRGEKPESDLFLDMVEDFGYELVCFSSKNFKPELLAEGKTRQAKLEEWRTSYDNEVSQRLEGFEHHLDVLAGYMLIVSRVLCERYNMINLHPATPDGPKGAWQEVIWELIRTRATETGVMMHLVTTELDRGPPITYCRFSIRGGEFDPLWTVLEVKLEKKSLKDIEIDENEAEPYFEIVREEGVKRELPLIIHTLSSFAGGKIYIKNNEVFEGDKKFQGGYDLTEEIESLILKQKAKREK